MALLTHPEQTVTAAPTGDVASGDDDDFVVEPVATHPGDASRDALPPAARIERLRRLALELRIAALETELWRARRRHDEVIERYEQVLADREGERGSPVFSWLNWR